ncbi:MAG: gliding motility-associated C-terminal domain-containing protein [Bacteroidales bacterium]|nr:gliding motility-associated C-terminal domain-containing protein [Bacteroidales bacterium]
MKDNKTYKSIIDELNNFEDTPTPQVWENIEKDIRKMRITKAGTMAAIGAAAVAAIVAIVLTTSPADNTVAIAEPIAAERPATSNSDKENTAHNNHDAAIQNNATTSTQNSGSAYNNSNTITTNSIVPAQKENATIATTNSEAKSNILPTDETYTAETTTLENITPIVQETTNTSITNNNNPVENDNNHYAEKTAEPTNNTESTYVNDSQKTESRPTDTQNTNTSKGEEEEDLYIPKAFTPNDVTNNRFYVIGKDIKTYEINIYDKHRQLVYKSKDINEAWDGTHNGENLATGTYVYYIIYIDKNNSRKQKQGTIFLLRK